MTMNFVTFAQGVLDDACDSLLPATIPTGDTSDPAGPGIAAIIGFAGSEVRGALGVSATAAGLEEIAKGLGVTEGGDAARFDALGELSNLLLGTVKREWARRGLVVTISTPQVLRGLSIEVCGAEDRDAENGWFEASAGPAGGDHVSVWLDVQTEGELTLDDPSAAEESIDQGDAILF